MNKNTFLLVSILLLSTAWAVAQDSPRNDAAGSRVTVEGCLSETGGNFMLTSQSGMSYQLTGNTDRLQDHVGQTIRVKGFGTPEADAAAGAPSSMSEGADADAQAPQGQSMLSVRSFKRVSSNCGRSGGVDY